MCNFDPKIGIFGAKSQFFVLESRYLSTGHITSMPGLQLSHSDHPEKISVSVLWVIFRGSPLVLAVSGHSHFAITVGIGIYNGEMVSNRLLSNSWLGLDDFFEKWFLTGYSATVGWVSMIFLADPLEISILMKWKKN